MGNSNGRTDAMVSIADVNEMKRKIMNGEWALAAEELMTREPEIAFLVATKFDKILAKLHEANPAVPDSYFSRELFMLVWRPLIMLDYAHRRQWEDFLPQDEDGGAK